MRYSIEYRVERLKEIAKKDHDIDKDCLLEALKIIKALQLELKEVEND